MFNPGEDDNEIDRLSREAASGYNAPGQPNWDLMQDLLDESMPMQERKRRAFLWWLAPAVLVIGALSYWQLKEPPAPEQISTPVAADPGSAKNVDRQNEAASANTNTTKKIIAAVDQGASTGSLTQFSSPKQSYRNKNGTIRNAEKGLSATGRLVSDASVLPAANDPVQDNTAVVKADEKNKDATPVSTATNPEIAPANENLQPVAGTAVAESKDSAVEKQLVTVKNKTAGRAWAIGLVGAVDETTIKFKYGYAPGYGIGVLAGYHFNKTFALYTGAVYTQKNYKMAGGDFTAPKGSWASYYKLETVEGYCRMWEVPLLARFYTRQTANKGFFLTTGISSYFMTHENYTYNYHYMGAPATRNIDYANSTTHFVSILDLSAGFESRIGNDLYMQIEPYAKLPLGGLGRGQIELSSFGINLGLQLRKSVKH